MDDKIKSKLASFPAQAKEKLFKLRRFILEVAESLEVGEIDEDLKWGQLSYSSRLGSPIRIDWSNKKPNQVSIFFHCQTKLVSTFRELYSDVLAFEGNRELMLPLDDEIDEQAIGHCISLALQYHKLKQLPMLGV